MKQCRKCQVDQPLTSFYRDKTRSDGYAPYCKSCRSKNAHEYYKANPDKLQEMSALFKADPKRVLSADLKRMNVTLEEYNRLLELQDGKCAICKLPETRTFKGVLRRLCVDHDHSCCDLKRYVCGNCNRGLICANCNTALGQFKDSIENLQAAIEYLTYWKTIRHVDVEVESNL